ncbi:DNA mismatch repair protein Mlh1 [Choanephora cucurbitarum]|uniref:DNA mismatch repair protein Mlh1 n=1 Tax=Choanephora cucurbitarum TaxID=101091 RepID=A0A1C7N1R5_9FUNG|nr:DNA mismatch repair protein Mlh1 [Choanephora cucurbitarum]
MSNIKKLDRTVVSKIAAGETIHYPYNVVKELMENSLDAGATSIRICALSGGLKLIRIIDNGHGISEQDLQLVCERHATSKIENYQDITQLTTFGFRGEAMASIANISEVTITSKYIKSEQVFQIGYKHGQLVGWPKSLKEEKLVGWLKSLHTGNGTAVLIQNLFDNMPLRKKALKISQESQKITDCIQKYAIHNAQATFSLSKDAQSETLYYPSQSITTEHDQSKSVVKRIKDIYGYEPNTINRVSHGQERWRFTVYYSDVDRYKNTKPNVFILFVNRALRRNPDRLVENAKIKKEVKQVYTAIGNSAKGSMFTYIDITVNPKHVDVNIHPTKNQVRLLEEDAIIKALTKQLYDAIALGSSCVSPKTLCQTKSRRLLSSQTTLDQYFIAPKISPKTSDSEESDNSQSTIPSTPTNGFSPIEASFFKKRIQNLSFPVIRNQTKSSVDIHQSSNNGSNLEQTAATDDMAHAKRKKARLTLVTKPIQPPSKSKRNTFNQSKAIQAPEHEQSDELESIQLLQKEISQSEDKHDVLLLGQYKNAFYVFQYQVVSEEYIYQRIIYQFPQFGKLMLSTPLNIMQYLSNCREYDPDDILNINMQIILEHAELLSECFKTETEVKEGQINWKDEVACLQGLAEAYAKLFYCCHEDDWKSLSKSMQQVQGIKAHPHLIQHGYVFKMDIK